MSLSNGFFLLFCIVVIILFCVPIQFQFRITHKKQWFGTLTIKFLFWQYTLQRTGEMWFEKTTPSLEQSVKLNWTTLLSFGREVMHILAERLRLQHFSIVCCIGWERADYTAYSYGLFWAMVSALPTQWLKCSDILYEPDFYTSKKEVAIEGIIQSTIAQLIGMTVALLRFAIREMLQNRKEQIES